MYILFHIKVKLYYRALKFKVFIKSCIFLSIITRLLIYPHPHISAMVMFCKYEDMLIFCNYLNIRIINV